MSGVLESRPSFSSSVVWHTLPLPLLAAGQRRKICAAGEAILVVRARYDGQTLAELYNPDKLPEDLASAHKHLDAYVDTAFGAKGLCSDEESRQEILFQRYKELSLS